MGVVTGLNPCEAWWCL